MQPAAVARVHDAPSFYLITLTSQDQDVAKASGHMVDLSGRLQDLETCLKESRSQESKLREDSEENRLRYKEAGHKVRQLKGEERIQGLFLLCSCSWRPNDHSA